MNDEIFIKDMNKFQNLTQERLELNETLRSFKDELISISNNSMEMNDKLIKTIENNSKHNSDGSGTVDFDVDVIIECFDGYLNLEEFAHKIIAIVYEMWIIDKNFVKTLDVFPISDFIKIVEDCGVLIKKSKNRIMKCFNQENEFMQKDKVFKLEDFTILTESVLSVQRVINDVMEFSSDTTKTISDIVMEKTKEYEKRLEIKSRHIPTKIKDNVWNRDGGKCVECGSNENLEFDHIIPFSEGGANTYRNLQLLCEPCNRKKSNNIG